jgi:hypothetical protein
VAAALAVDKNNASKNACMGDLCTGAGKSDRSAAVTDGNVATAGVIAGAALAAAGVTMFLFGRRSEGTAAPTAAVWQAFPAIGPTSAGAVLSGRF